MAGQDTTAYDEVLKDVYEGGIRELIPTKVKMLDRFLQKEARDWGGRTVTYPVHVRRNQGSGWASENGNLPAAQMQGYTNTRIPMRFQYGRILLTAQVMKASQGERHAFAAAMEQEMRGIITDMSSERGRAIWGDGRGVFALVNGDPGTGTTVTVDAPGGIAGATNGARFLNPGMAIAFIDPTTGTMRASANRTIQSIASTGTTITVDSAMAAAVADNDYIVRVNTTGATDVSDSGYQKEMMGLLGLIDDGTYVQTLHNINRTTYPLWASNVITGVGALSADVIQRGIDLADQLGDGEISLLAMHHSVRRAYLAVTNDARRYVGSDLLNPDAGTRAARGRDMSFGGITVMAEKYAPYSMIFGIDESYLTRYTMTNGEWADEDGAILCRVGTGSAARDAFEAFYRIWDNSAFEKPASSFRLEGITATVVVAHVH
jgi:hypothetical protein